MPKFFDFWSVISLTNIGQEVVYLDLFFMNSLFLCVKSLFMADFPSIGMSKLV